MPTKIFEGEVIHVWEEDSGQARVADIRDNNTDDKDTGVFLRIHSWDAKKEHAEWSKMGVKVGAKVLIGLSLDN
jgi:hypothetical protein